MFATSINQITKMRGIILLALLGTVFAVPENIQKIVGGSPTEVAQYPFITNMQYHYFGLIWSQACGGALITASSVLSASHCYYSDLTSFWRVRVGTSRASSGGTVHSIAEIVIHPEFDPNLLVNDVAIVKLDTPAVYSDLVKPARIAGSNYILTDNTDVINIGWGALSSGGTYPEDLQEVTVQIINHQVCTNRYAYLKSLPNFSSYPDVTVDMLCSGILDVGGKDACQGDSGGPLIHNNDIVVGVVSWGYQCADATYPRVNARVSHHSNWISANGAA